MNLEVAIMERSYTVRELSESEFVPLFDRHKHSVFEDVHSYSPRELFTASELQRIEDPGPGTSVPYRLFLGAFNSAGEFVGWSWGELKDTSTFYMVNSAVLPDHRRKGIYSALIDRCVDVLSTERFQIIFSRHCVTNNAVIIPKLKAGFIIAAMEIDDKYGVLVHLRFYTNKDRRKVMDYRSGQSKPNEKIKQIFNL